MKKNKTKQNKKKIGRKLGRGRALPFSFFLPPPPPNFLRAFHFGLSHTPSCLPHYLYYLRAWNRLEWYRSASDASCMHASCISCMPASCIGTVRIRNAIKVQFFRESYHSFCLFSIDSLIFVWLILAIKIPSFLPLSTHIKKMVARRTTILNLSFGVLYWVAHNWAPPWDDVAI